MSNVEVNLATEKARIVHADDVSPERMIAGAAMAFSSVSVVTNALLLRRWKPASRQGLGQEIHSQAVQVSPAPEPVATRKEA